MEELLQLHVVIPDETPDRLDAEIDGRFDDVYDLISWEFPVPNRDTPSYEHFGLSVSSSLFERRADNLEQVDEIEAQLDEWYPNASVFRSSYKQPFGEFRSTADPDAHIMLLVTNWGVQKPAIRWKRRKETLEAPPLVLGDEVYHANRDGIFGINTMSGDIQWECDIAHVIQVPVGNNNQIIGNTGQELVALDQATGNVQWRTEFDHSEGEIIDSRVTLGGDNAYVGLRTGEVIALSLDIGEPTVLCECDDPVVRLSMIGPGLIVKTGGGTVYLVDSSGADKWPQDREIDLSILHRQDGYLYGIANGSLLALAEEDGAVEWEVDFPPVRNIVQYGDTLFTTTNGGVVPVDAETGTRVGDFYEVEDFTTVSNAVVVDGIIACVTSSDFVDEEYYICEQNTLHLFDPTNGTELQTFELGVGDCYGLSVAGDTIVCSAGGELFCLENLPEPA